MKHRPLRRAIAASVLSLICCLAALPVFSANATKTADTRADARAPSSTPAVYPPNWWVGMRDPRLQIMLRAPDIGAGDVRLDDTARARIVRVVRGDSPNYLFVDLEIAADAAPGDLRLRLTAEGRERTLRYALWPRKPGSAERRGFDGRDAILNLMPDRFANGDPGNDRVAGYVEGANRDHPGGRHGGDLRGLRQRLDYIAGMGYTMVWPTPLIENAQTEYSYHGYAATDLYRI
ncbi:MAG: cyclomaltodextrinase N-terminal domain-containing protein, partial [Xanthomonadaceae bacterium]|nr:cyclomaltodextrinase N-terminal domain-containing protein [Xanthomonadaceae bacterium]